jgi:MFS transporter, DHA2 family, methylenomycin A resistance protein
VLVAMCLAVLIAQVDTSVVNLATHAIGATFHVATRSLQMVLDAYNLTYAVLLLTGGLVADLCGRRLAFLLGAAIMTGASLACAAAPNAGTLIAARAGAGIGAALLVPSSLTIIRAVWTECTARDRVLGIWASCNGLAFVIGPGLGGLLIGCFGWRSVFLLIVPLGVAAWALARFSVPESSNPEGRHLDLLGQLLGALAIGGLAVAAIAGQDHSRQWIEGATVAILAFPLFLLTERQRGRAALVPLDIFVIRPFSGAVAATGSMTFGVYGLIFLLPLVWQSDGRLDAQQAGLALVPLALAFFVLSNCSGPIGLRVGARLMTAGGTALVGTGLLVVAATDGGHPMALTQGGLMLAGCGMGLNTGPLYAVVVGAVGSGRSGTASALINVARMTGATLGVALLGRVFDLLHGGPAGLRAAMLFGGMVQFCGAFAAWATIRR